MEYVLIYFIVGLVWESYLEAITTKVDGSREWTDLERFFQVTGWPIFLSIFIITLIKES